MSQDTKGRWWEDYLVRYLTPMVVGSSLLLLLIFIISTKEDASMESLSLFWKTTREASAGLAIGVLIGGLGYAYLCSTPITVFHAGRMIKKGLNTKATTFWYLWAGLSLLALIGILADAASGLRGLERCRERILLCIAALPAMWLLVGQYDVIWRLKKDKENDIQSEFLGFYANLALSRGGTSWALEMRQSYTHMREHANSVFICVAEISVAACLTLVWQITQDATSFVLTALLAALIWTLPNVFLWSIANKLEAFLVGSKNAPIQELRDKARDTVI